MSSPLSFTSFIQGRRDLNPHFLNRGRDWSNILCELVGLVNNAQQDWVGFVQPSTGACGYGQTFYAKGWDWSNVLQQKVGLVKGFIEADRISPKFSRRLNWSNIPDHVFFMNPALSQNLSPFKWGPIKSLTNPTRGLVKRPTKAGNIGQMFYGNVWNWSTVLLDWLYLIKWYMGVGELVKRSVAVGLTAPFEKSNAMQKLTPTLWSYFGACLLYCNNLWFNVH